MTNRRRGFFRDALAGLRKLVDEVSEDAESPPVPTFVPPPVATIGAPIVLAPLTPRRPPGALAESEFLGACTRCGACVTACPEASLVSNGGLPEAQVDKHPCVMCADVPCAAACDTGALVHIKREAIRFGTMKVLARLCLNDRPSDDAPCERCADWCPVPGALTFERAAGAGERSAIDERQIPRIDPALCSGCGLCAAHCAAYPRALG